MTVYKLRCPTCGGFAATTLAPNIRGIPICGACKEGGTRVVLVEEGRREGRLVCETCKSDAPENIKGPRDSVAHLVAETDGRGLPTGGLRRCGFWVTVAVLLALLPARANASDGMLHFEPPGPVAIAMHVGALAMMALDASTTLDLKNHRYAYEGDALAAAIIGRHPRDGAIVASSLGLMLAHSAVWYVAPREVRAALDAVTIGIELPVVGGNFASGLRLRVPFL